MVLQETYTLNNGITVPKLAFGTWQIPNEKAPEAVKAALAIGYRHIDTAVLYKNETGVGEGIRESGIPREEIFVTTKIPPEVTTYEDAKACIEGSIKKLNVGVIDQVLIHSPKPWDEILLGTKKSYFKENLAVWKAMEEAVVDGKVRSIGVSNFDVADLANIVENGTILPAVDQLEVHIGHTPAVVMKYCKDHNILIMAYSPNATGLLKDNPLVVSLAEKYHVSVPQLSIRYDLQLGTMPLPRSTNPVHMKENAALDFEISGEDMRKLGEIENIRNLGWTQLGKALGKK